MKRDFEKKLPSKVPVERQGLRVSIQAMAQMRRRGRHKFTVQAFDLSMEGCKLEFFEEPRVDETIWIKFERIEAIQAKVRWCDANVAGVEFVRPLYRAVFDFLIKRMNSGNPL